MEPDRMSAAEFESLWEELQQDFYQPYVPCCPELLLVADPQDHEEALRYAARFAHSEAIRAEIRPWLGRATHILLMTSSTNPQRVTLWPIQVVGSH